MQQPRPIRPEQQPSSPNSAAPPYPFATSPSSAVSPPPLSLSPQVEEKIIKLNIGGYRYITTRETLTKKGENFFTSLLSGRFAAIKDEKGFYFIDRDGEYFKPIIEYLRTGEYYIPKGMEREAVFREALFYSINLPSEQQMHRSPSLELKPGLCHDGFYLPTHIKEQRGIVSNASVLFFRKDGTGHFSDAKEFTYTVQSGDLSLVTITCNNLPYNFLLLDSCLSDGTSEFRFFKPEEPHQLVYYYGYISIPETDISAILFGETHVFLRFSKRVLVRVGNDKSSLNAALFNIKKAEDFLGFPSICVDIKICKAASWEVQEASLQILSFGDFLLVRDLKSSSCSFYVFHQNKPVLH